MSTTKGRSGSTRRGFLVALGATTVGGVLGGLLRPAQAARVMLRPPGALPDLGEFLGRCIGGRRCAQVCPNGCIDFLGVEAGLSQWGSPYIDPRNKNCILCMACTQACPTGALTPIGADTSEVASLVRMGTAEVDEHICLSFNGFTCGTCVRACPLEGVALRAGMYERPVVDPSRCVGCGACERACIQTPQAIRVRPAHGAPSLAGRS